MERFQNKTYDLVSNNIHNGCQTWSLTRMEKHMLRMYENRVQRMICGICSIHWEGIEHSFCSGNLNGKAKFGRTRKRRVGNIKTDIQET
jgi:hypothetical protein